MNHSHHMSSGGIGRASFDGFDGLDGFGQASIVYKKKAGYKMTRQYMMGELLGEGSQGKVRWRHAESGC